MSKKEVLYEKTGSVARLVLNRPAKLNALNPDMLDMLEAGCRKIAEDSTIRAVLISGKGEKAFCAGADISAWAQLDHLAMWRRWIRRGHEVFGSIEQLPVPVIALVDGIAFGGGLELALSADVLICSASSRFAFPETAIAAVPGWGGTFRLAERIGQARARQMLFTGEQIHAETAVSWGLVNEVHEGPALQKRSDELAQRICANAPVAVSCTKQLMRLYQLSRDRLGSMESVAGGFAASTSDAQEGLEAYFAKRKPEYSGK